MIHLIKTCIALCMLLSFNSAYAAACSGNANEAAQQAYNWFNDVEELSDNGSQIAFCYSMRPEGDCIGIFKFKAIAQCDTTTGKYVPSDPSTTDGFYSREPSSYCQNDPGC